MSEFKCKHCKLFIATSDFNDHLKNHYHIKKNQCVDIMKIIKMKLDKNLYDDDEVSILNTILKTLS